MIQIEQMTTQARVTNGDSHAAGRARQRLKNAAIGYNSSRHGVDATVESALAARMFLCLMAVEFVETLPGAQLSNRRIDLYRQGDSEMLAFVALAYAGARHGIDADVGMAREGLAMLCQASINFVESLPMGETKRPVNGHPQIGTGA